MDGRSLILAGLVVWIVSLQTPNSTAGTSSGMSTEAEPSDMAKSS